MSESREATSVDASTDRIRQRVVVHVAFDGWSGLVRFTPDGAREFASRLHAMANEIDPPTARRGDGKPIVARFLADAVDPGTLPPRKDRIG